MSIYSGFATRQQQQSYDELVQDLIFVLQKRVLKFYHHEDADESKFLDILIHIHQQMDKMQESKYLEPKTSKSIEELLKFLLRNSEKDMKSSKNIGPGSLYNTKPQSQQIISGRKTIPILNTSNKIRKQKIEQYTSNRVNSHKKSPVKLQQPSSIGKIVKQIYDNNENYNTLADSRNTFINKNKKNKRDDQSEDEYEKNNSSYKKNIHNKIDAGNPEQTEENNWSDKKYFHTRTTLDMKSKPMPRRDKSFHGKVLGKSTIEREQGQQKCKESKDYIMEYLQKNHKNYLRGYQKKSVRIRAYSKEHLENI